MAKIKTVFLRMPDTTDSVISRLGIESLNEMQQSALQAIKQNPQTLLLSDTGSGKTLAFLLPVLDLLDPATKGVQAMIIVPSRELALQIDQVFRKMQTGFKLTTCYGGHKREIEENSLSEAPALIIGTPGRIADHLRRKNFDPDSIRMLVIDEFDKALEFGFLEEISFIISQLTNLEKRVLSSATRAADLPALPGFADFHELDFLSGKAADQLDLKYVDAFEKDKLPTLFNLLCFIGNRPTIVFCNHREAVERTSQLLSDRKINNVFYHGAMEQRDRELALCRFRNGSANFLITTDLASRGLDIPYLRYIIHYHLPQSSEVFVHRNGRTARMDASGTAILIIGPEEKIPAYIPQNIEGILLSEDYPLPEKPKWTTFYFAAGKKDKLNKVDLVGFLSQKGGLKKEDIGLIEVKDHSSFVAIRKPKAAGVLHLIEKEKIKNKKVKIEIAK